MARCVLYLLCGAPSRRTRESWVPGRSRPVVVSPGVSKSSVPGEPVGPCRDSLGSKEAVGVTPRARPVVRVH